ncbi:mesoderm-specific transcript protein-like [Actinia tenebrosa]|uniref:Mesoderm-specific transcript protein-like n=1 Tax=Actinia tenebrosa TaxID=6105 RepID=A0A6P8J2Z1_ACTTE|nr:mesoderm-specific transcript protein-like [Actinia tenebrosa]
MSAKSQVFIFVFVVLISVYLNFPPPEVSERLKEWRSSGKYLSYEGLAVFYKDELGAGDKNQVVVCIHGFPTSSFDWSKIWDSLKANFGHVIALDMLGLGFSDKPLDRNYTVDEQATIYELMLKELGVVDVHIIAHDLGDTVAQEMLARYEERKNSQQENVLRIQSLCLSNGGIFPETNFPRLIQKLMLISWLGPGLSRMMSFPIFKVSFSEIFGPQSKPTADELLDFYSLVRYKDGHLVVPNLLQYINQRKEHKERWVGALQKSSVPIHLIYGPSDPVNPPAMLDRFRTKVPKATNTELAPGIGHYPHWEDPQEFLNSYWKFLKQIKNNTSKLMSR